MLGNFLANLVASSPLLNAEQRLAHYCLLGLRSADSAFIASQAFFEHPDLSNVVLGVKSFVNHQCYFDNRDSITLEDNACLGPRVTILTTTHTIGGPERRVGSGCTTAPVTVGSGAWVGAGAVIFPGVTIGSGVVIGAGSVVRKSCDPGWLYAGNPARKIRRLPDNLSDQEKALVEQAGPIVIPVVHPGDRGVEAWADCSLR